MQVYAPNDQIEYPFFLLDVEAAFQVVATADSFIIRRHFNVYVDDDPEKWRKVIGRNGGSNVNPTEEMLGLRYGLKKTNGFFQHKATHKYT